MKSTFYTEKVVPHFNCLQLVDQIYLSGTESSEHHHINVLFFPTVSMFCEDIDECSAEHDCGDICVNTEGSYTCDCGQGYTLDDNGVTCTLNCGGRLTESSGSFHTPDWPEPYPSLDFRCEWEIDLENQTDVIIELSFDVIYGIHGGDPCPTDYVEIFDGFKQDSVSLGRHCSLTAPDPVLTSTNKATVIFQASTFQNLPSRVGTLIIYRAIYLGRYLNIPALCILTKCWRS